MMGKMCQWYNQTSGMKRAYDKGLLDKKWIENAVLVIFPILFSPGACADNAYGL